MLLANKIVTGSGWGKRELRRRFASSKETEQEWAKNRGDGTRKRKEYLRKAAAHRAIRKKGWRASRDGNEGREKKAGRGLRGVLF